MKKILDFFERGNIPVGFLLASVFLAFASVMSFLVIPTSIVERTEMRIEPLASTVTLGEEFTVSILLDTTIPVNAFEALIRFKPETFEVTGLNFSNSIANLWVHEPTADNTEGTVTFTGGTTETGGFTGEQSIVDITLRAKTVGEATLFIENTRVLRSTADGADAVVSTPLDANVIVERLEELPENSGVTLSSIGATYDVSPEPPPPTDINQDGEHTIADISIFMLHMRGGEPAYDFNRDGHINTKDLSILLRAVTN